MTDDRTPRTPTPWPEPEYDNYGNGGFSEWWNVASGRFHSEADATLAYRAVNSHAALVEALRTTEAYIASIDSPAALRKLIRAALALAQPQEEMTDGIFSEDC